jgi:ABC-type glycerol-3-phosphate transport system substrate-binding protein
MMRVLENFAEQQPDIALRLVYRPLQQMREALAAAKDSGQGPTLFLAPSKWGPDLWEADLIKDIGDWALPEIHLWFYPLAWDAATYQGVMIGFPLELQGTVLYRNRLLVEEPAATVEEFITANKALKRMGLTAGAALDFGFDFTGGLLSICGGEVIGEDGDVGFLGDAGICWLSLAEELKAAGSVTFDAEVARKLFEEGQTGWFIGSSDRAQSLRAILGEGVLGVDPWPREGGQSGPLAGLAWTENLYLAATARQEDLAAARALAQFLISAEAQQLLADPSAAGHLPAINAVELEDAFQRQLMDVLSHDVAFPMLLHADEVAKELEQAINLGSLRGVNKEYALRLAAEDVRQLLGLP